MSPPVLGEVKAIAPVLVLLQAFTFAILFTVAVGNTVMVYIIAVPVHPLADGVTVIVLVTAEVPVLTAVNEGISVSPLASASPIVAPPEMLYVTLEGMPVKERAGATAPLHTI